MRLLSFAVVATAFLTCLAALADSDLQITELWAGGLDGSEATSDWFELTNFGDMPATGLDGNLYWDDDSFDPEKDDQLFGIDTIAAGESVIYVLDWEDDFGTSSNAINAFTAMWDAPNGDLSGVQIGYVDGGSGLSGSGDAAAIFDGNTSAAMLIDGLIHGAATEESYVGIDDSNLDFSTTTTLSQAGVNGAYASNFNATDDAQSSPAIGSPGVAVPEPSSLVLTALGLLGMFNRRSK